MADWDLSDLAQELSDLAVALLLCLIAHEHPLIETTDECLGDVAQELALICANTFGLSCAILDCSSATSVEEFCDGIASSRARLDDTSDFASLKSIDRDIRGVVDVVIAKNFNHLDDYFQLQAVELMRSRNATIGNTKFMAPMDFLFVPLIGCDSNDPNPKLNAHVNDHIFISHYHDPNKGYTYLEDGTAWLSDDQMSTSSVIHRPAGQTKIPLPDLEKFRQESNTVTTSADVVRYQQDIIVFLRLSRAVAGGVSTKASNHFSRFSKLTAALHGLDYLTPSITALAAKKVFLHRVVVAKPEDDRSLQYGSDRETVTRVLTGVGPEDILDSVLALESPL